MENSQLLSVVERLISCHSPDDARTWWVIIRLKAIMVVTTSGLHIADIRIAQLTSNDIRNGLLGCKWSEIQVKLADRNERGHIE